MNADWHVVTGLLGVFAVALSPVYCTIEEDRRGAELVKVGTPVLKAQCVKSYWYARPESCKRPGATK